ncbi:MAG: FAD-binding oxidoreductase [Actinobacteria bacterium]|nr:FAD-binding oxidoreductase [Actinomycetota bacterium]MBW3642782.1 FAD-binding oxidoreductase [Actinomycetota bacterium]
MAPDADPRTETPSSPDEAGEVMRAAGAQGRRLRIRGGGTKSSWGTPTDPPDVVLSSERLDRVVEHNEGDLTAVLQGGVPLARAQEALADSDQMVALDPPLGNGDGATIGGVVATGDTGPLRHRYGAPRDLILGITVALTDGTVARAGGKVIKNVAGYDLAKLFTGSFGTLGLIVEVVMRLHPRPPRTVTVLGCSDDPDALGAAASAVAHSPFGPECLDVSWREETGEVMARFGGTAPDAGAAEVMVLLQQAGLEARLAGDDDDRWDRQRARQRSTDGAVVRVSGLASELPRVVRSAREVGASLVGRAGLGLSWMALGQAEAGELVSAIEEVRRRLHPFPCVVLDAPVEVREKVEVWGDDRAVPPLMRRVKTRFDPPGVCNPGIFVGGI